MMTNTTRRGGQQRTPYSSAPVPAPRQPLEEGLNHAVGSTGRAAQSGHLDTNDLAGVLNNLSNVLAEVAVWTSSDGHWGEHASFLLHTHDDRWHALAFSDPAAGELVTKLAALPGFANDRLLTLIGQRHRRIVTLWRAPG